MSYTPSPNNYVLGRGVVYFDRRDPDTGLLTGERDLGNAPAFSLTLDLETLEHFSSRAGLRAKDKEVTLQITPSVSFQLDEVNVENVKLIYLAESSTVNQPAGDVSSTTIVGNKGRFRDLGSRNVGVLRAYHGAVAGGPFVAGETVTGGTSGATAVVLEVDSVVGGTNTLDLFTIGGTPPFVDGEVLTGGTSTATATTDFTGQTQDATTGLVFDTTDMFVETTVGTTRLVKGTDYTIDSKVGRIKFLSGGTFTEAEDITVRGYALATTYVSVNGFADTEVEGFLRFVGDNASGPSQELKIWRVALRPDGEVAYIGDDFATLSFTGEILKDEACHPTIPFMEIIMEEDTEAGAGSSVCDGP